MPTTQVPFRQDTNVPPVPRPALDEGELAPRLFGNEHALAEMPELFTGLGSREQIEAELDSIGQAIRTFHAKQADQVFEEASAYSARLAELYVLLHRIENTAYGKSFVRIRTQQVDIYRQELEFQFKLASRKVEVMRQDIALAGGMA